MDTSLSTFHTAHPRTWKITDLCTTTLSQRHRIYTLHWSDIHYFLLLHPTDKQKWWGTYCWLAPCAIECLHLFSRLSALHLPQLSALWQRARNYRGRRAATWTTIDCTQLSCPGTTKDQLLAPWQLKLFWEPRIRTALEFTWHKSSNQRKQADTALFQLLSLDKKIQSGIVLVMELHAHYVSSAQQKLQNWKYF